MAYQGRKFQPRKWEGPVTQTVMGVPIEEFHMEDSPLDYIKKYLNSRERRFIKHLTETGDFVSAHKIADFKATIQHIMNRRHIRIAMYRMATLAIDPKIAAKMATPLIAEQRLYIAMTGTNTVAMKAMSDIEEASGVERKNLHIHASVPADRINIPDRPWAVPAVKAVPALPVKGEPE